MLESITAFAILVWLVMNLLPLLLFMKKEEIRLQHQLDYYRYLVEMTEEYSITKKIRGRRVVVDGELFFLRAETQQDRLIGVAILNENYETLESVKIYE
ncbi:hypothetical protein ACWN8V_06190 [Vagococcus elongatus]|uniref:Uncharacterized protein n=1 Tax=Vagococcus elongatus TaxID=180344 RepID=A0A430B138_9ENTE|nr:hypothetical protein [Vagococcus elongatus]RSU14035.1 hypothetical protein CBF29_03890 [Vagococcus elongatus]